MAVSKKEIRPGKKEERNLNDITLSLFRIKGREGKVLSGFQNCVATVYINIYSHLSQNADTIRMLCLVMQDGIH